MAMGAGTMSADQTLGVLKTHMAELKAYCIPEGLFSDADSVASDASDLGNLTFTCKYFRNMAYADFLFCLRSSLMKQSLACFQDEEESDP